MIYSIVTLNQMISFTLYPKKKMISFTMQVLGKQIKEYNNTTNIKRN